MPRVYRYLFDKLIFFTIMFILFFVIRFVFTDVNKLIIWGTFIGVIIAGIFMLQSLVLVYDIFQGVTEKQTTILGFLSEEKLDVFYKIKYVNVYFDDKEHKKHYIVFVDDINEDLKQGDAVIIHYYKESRVVTSIKKIKDG